MIRSADVFSPRAGGPEAPAGQEIVELPVLDPEAVVPCCPPITAGELSPQDAERMAMMFKALSDPVRLRLFSKVASHPGGEACVCDIQDVGAFPCRPSPTT